MQNPIKQHSAWIRAGIESGWIEQYESELLDFVSEEYGEMPEEAEYAVIFLSLFVKAGHVSLPLDKPVSYWIDQLDLNISGLQQELTVHAGHLFSHSAFDDPDGHGPFLIEENRLFIRKYYKQEILVAERLTDLTSMDKEVRDIHKAAAIVDDYFDETGDIDINWQKAAAALSIKKRLLIISGGPGTGKTTTVARIIAVLLKTETDKLRIALAAPTGKAAARMSEALQNSLSGLNQPELMKSKIPSEAQTLHRLMKGYGSDNLLPEAEPKTLPYDLIVIDEASMIDIVMMERLLRFMDDKTRLIILGDKNQLSSVEAGSVFADICMTDGNRFSTEIVKYLSGFNINEGIELYEGHPLEDSIIYLEKNYRFGDESGIAALSRAVNSGNPERADTLVAGSEFEEISWSAFNYNKVDIQKLFTLISESVMKASDYDDAALLDHCTDSIWLGALRKGPFGSDTINRMIEEYLLRKKLIFPENGWYHGRPVMITRNDYSIGVYNGDLGVCVDRENSKMEVVFTDNKGHLKRISPYRIKHFEPAYILTVHKSQGSEFNHVNFILPGRDTKLLTKELIYTAITRARKSFRLWGNRELFKTGIERKTVRFTGLQSRLYSPSRGI